MQDRRTPSSYLVYLIVRVLAALMQALPIDVNLALARRFARIWRVLVPRHHRRCIEHLKLAYGESLDEVELDRIASRCMEHWAMFGIEVICGPRYLSRWNWSRHLTLVNLEPALQVLLRGNGAILVTGHYGHFELVGHFIAAAGFDVTAVMRPLDNGFLNDYVVRTRQMHGLRLLDKFGATREIPDLLSEGSLIGFIADQDAGRKGLFVDFFGRPASTYKSIGLLAMEARVPILVGFARRLSERFEYEIVVQEVLVPEDWESEPDPLRWITQRYTSLIEQAAREVPEQYLWIHRRWKSEPGRRRGHRSAEPVAAGAVAGDPQDA